MGKKYLSLFLVFTLLVLGIFPSQLSLNTFAAGDDMTALLSEKSVVVSQNGTTIPENGTLEFDKNINVRFDFSVPVLGDTTEGDPNIIEKGDTASFIIAEGFSLQSAASFDLQFGGVKVGTLNITSEADNRLRATVIFDGADDVFDGDYSDVRCYFEASLQYVGHTSGSSAQDYNVVILDKTYTVHVPALPVVIGGEKEGVKKGEFIDWTVKVEAKQGADQVDLSGYTFSDNLSSVGALVGTFKIGTTPDGVGAIDLDPQPTQDGNTYTHTFAAGSVGPKYLFYRTAIAQDLVSNGNRTITNTARILKDDVEQISFTDSVTFPNQWIEKDSGTTNVDKSNPTNHVGTITWKIIVNHMEASLPNAIVTDALDSKLDWVSARWTTWNSDTNSWEVAYTDIPAEPADGKYALSNESIVGVPHLTKKAILEITTRVDAAYNVGHEVQTINNSATLSWDGVLGIGSGNKQTTIGMYPITKTGGTYDPSTHEIPWTVTVKASDVNADLRVLDLLVYDTTFNVNNVALIEGNAAEGSLLHVSAADLTKLTPSYSQKYNPATFTGEGLKPTVYPLKNASGNVIAELILVTESTDTGIDVTGGDRTFTYNSVVTNPSIYAANGSSNVRNNASLFSANVELNERQASVNANSVMTSKNMLTATNALDVHANRNTAAASNITAFNYIDKSVVFRLYVNRNGITNLTNDLTTDVTKSFGSVSVTDTLPAGWEFVEIAPGKNFLLYEGDRTVNSGTVTITAQDTEISETLAGFTSDFSVAGKGSFEFQSMDHPYVIYVKARPTASTQTTYFNNNLTTNVDNTLNFKSTNWSGHNTTASVQIKSQIVDKTFTTSTPANGLVSWKIDYKPYEMNPANPLGANLRIEDVLPAGMDLMMNASGNVDIAASQITVNELNLQIDGSYAVGDAVTLALGVNLLYDFNTRTLTFKIPDSAPDKGYRLTYLTEINGNSGTTLTNTVKLIGADFTQVNKNKSYTVSTADAGATMVRSGWVEITKVANNTPLAGAKFAITTADKSKVFRSGTTDGNGKLILRGLPSGNYFLIETDAPAGYELSTREYAIKVDKVDNVSTTSIDGKTGVNSHKITVVNHLTGATGHLKLQKAVIGNLGDLTKTFDFTVHVIGAVGNYSAKKVNADSIITYVDLTFSEENATVQLKHNESLEIFNLPESADFTITEDNNTLSGHTPKPSGDCTETTGNIATGTIAADDTQEITFTNRKQSIPVEPEPTQPTTEPTTEAATEATTETSTNPPVIPNIQETVEKTVVDEPKEGHVPVPENAVVEIKETPSNGEAEVDAHGNWTYTPDHGFIGKDEFEILVTDSDDSEEIYLIEIEIEEIPLGPALPRTGQLPTSLFVTIGTLLTGAGLMIRRKK